MSGTNVLKYAIVVILINLLFCDQSNSELGFFDPSENKFHQIPKSHQKNYASGIEENEKYSQKNPYSDDFQLNMHDWINSRSIFAKNQASANKRDVWNKASTVVSQNKNMYDVNASSPLLIFNNNNKTNEFDDLKEILNQIYGELDTIKAAKMCTDKDPDGNNCDVNGTWNAAKIGLRIELSTTAAVDGNKLIISLAEKIPKKPTYRIDATWNCSGSIVHKNGGPFYFHCLHKQSPQSMAIFHGICKKCSGFDTIFGEWIFQNIPSDCRQLWTFSETKRDVFHKISSYNLLVNENVNNTKTTMFSVNKNGINAMSKTKPVKFRRNTKHFENLNLN